jgi:glycosyltransferase involved in cell wall biosynthesis
VIGGTSPLRDELDIKVRDYHLSDQVGFTGFIPETDLPLAYRAADLSILPSQTLEGFGMTALESLVCGTPVLVTPVGGLPELVLTDSTAGTLAKSLDQFLRGGLALPSAADCRRYVEANFSRSKITELVSNLYWEVATG